MSPTACRLSCGNGCAMPPSGPSTRSHNESSAATRAAAERASPPPKVGLARLAHYKTRPGQARGAWVGERTEFVARLIATDRGGGESACTLSECGGEAWPR